MSTASQVSGLRKRGRPTADERRARETEILTAALGVFLRSGYSASTVDDLAAAAQVTKRTLYAYYGDKAGVFAAMVRDLATTVSLSAASDSDTLETLAARIVIRVHSDELVGLHQLVIAESNRFPELARILHNSGDVRHIARLGEHIRVERSPAREPLAEPLFSLLLGEKHRRRLLGIDPPPTPTQAAAHADAALAILGLTRRNDLTSAQSPSEGGGAQARARRRFLEVDTTHTESLVCARQIATTHLLSSGYHLPWILRTRRAWPWTSRRFRQPITRPRLAGSATPWKRPRGLAATRS